MIESYKINMQRTTKRVLLVTGIISGVIGITETIPAGLQNNISLLVLSGFLVVLGVILIAIGFND